MDEDMRTGEPVEELLHAAFRSSGDIGYYMLYSALKRKRGGKNTDGDQD